MKITCDNCGAKYSIADEKVRGKVFKIRCKKCSNIIVVRGTQDAEAPQGDGAAAAGPEAASGDAVWHVVIGREQVGPMSPAEVRERFAAGEINVGTYIWKEGFADWQRLSAVDEFADVGEATAVASSAAPAAQPIAAVAAVSPAAVSPAAVSPAAVSPAAVSPAGSAQWDHGSSGDSAGDWASPAAKGQDTERADARSLFGGGFAETQGNDLFATSVSAPEGEDSVSVGGGPVVSSTVEERAEPTGGLFGSSASSAQESRIPSDPSIAVDSPHMTGQRGENSVLFSLANLQALAMGGDKSPASAAKSDFGAAASPAPSAPTTAGGGSGLIDIRAMAASTVAAKSDEGHKDELPAIGGFAPPIAAAPVLLPTGGDERPRWVLPTIIGISSALVAAIAVVVVLLIGGGKQASQPVALNAGAVNAGAVNAGAATAAGAPTGTPGEPGKGEPSKASPGAKAGTAETAGTAGAAAKAADTAAAQPAAAAGTKEPDKKVSTASPRASRRRAARSSRRRASAHRTREPSASATPAPTRSKRPAARSSGRRDELDDLIDGALGGRKRKKAPKAAAPAPASNLPDRLERGQILSGMRRISPRVKGCYDRFKVPGLAMVKVSIAASGRVSAATVSGLFAGTPTGSCVSRAVMSSRFPATKNPTTVRYPFSLR